MNPASSCKRNQSELHQLYSFALSVPEGSWDPLNRKTPFVTEVIAEGKSVVRKKNEGETFGTENKKRKLEQ